VSAFSCRSDCVGLSFALELPLEDAVVVAISAGGVEVAYPIAFFQEQPIHWLVPPRLEVPPVEGRRVVLADDGLAAVDDLADVACLLRGAGARSVRLATPWLTAAARRRLAPLVDEIVTRRARPPRLTPYDAPEDPETAHRLVAWSARPQKA
jgi:predicted phosphoribosyltransferase